MKTFKTSLCFMIAAISLAFVATSAKASIGIVTNYDTLTITLTIKSTTTEIVTSKIMHKIVASQSKDIITTQHLADKNLIDLFTNADFAGTNFPAGAQLVIGWDQAWSGHVLVVDKTGTNVIYDATGSTNSFSINFHEALGADSGSRNSGNPGGSNITSYNFASVTLIDTGSMSFNLTGTGPCTEVTALSRNSAGEVLSWTDSEDFNFAGAAQTIPGSEAATISGIIHARGHAKDRPYYFTPQP